MRAGNYHEKEYEVTVDKKITETFIRKMSSGVPILGTVTRPCTVYKTGDKSFSIILTQGLNRQIRRMCEYLGYHVCTLKRIRIMNLTLDGLKCGEYREICGDEWKKLNELIRDSSSETVIRTGGQHGNISGRTNKRTGAEAERSGKGILSGRPGDHEQQRVRRTVRSTGKNGKGNRNRSFKGVISRQVGLGVKANTRAYVFTEVSALTSSTPDGAERSDNSSNSSKSGTSTILPSVGDSTSS